MFSWKAREGSSILSIAIMRMSKEMRKVLELPEMTKEEEKIYMLQDKFDTFAKQKQAKAKQAERIK